MINMLCIGVWYHTFYVLYLMNFQFTCNSGTNQLCFHVFFWHQKSCEMVISIYKNSHNAITEIISEKPVFSFDPCIEVCWCLMKVPEILGLQRHTKQLQ